MPVDGCARKYNTAPEEVHAGAVNDVGVNLCAHAVCSCAGLHSPVVHCRAARPKQAPLWGHTVMPGTL